MYMSDAKNIKALENSSVELTLTLPAARIEEDYQKSLAKYVKNAQIPGFRKGHVPASVLEKKFGESLRTETTFDTMEAFLKEELEKLEGISRLLLRHLAERLRGGVLFAKADQKEFP